jgi:hypothetical protein
MLHSYFFYYSTPKEERIFTTALSEYYLILEIRKNLPEDANILWLPRGSNIVNYYIYPRKIFRIEDRAQLRRLINDKDFLSQRNIKHIFFDYGQFYPVENIISGR